MQLALNLPNPLAARAALFLSTDGQPFTTSRAVAERFGKQHSHVLRSIEKLLADSPDPTFNESNFGFIEYTDSRGRQKPEYRLTHDGFALLAMGFTGRDALAWKIAFLQAFNALEAELHAKSDLLAAMLDKRCPKLNPVVDDALQGIGRGYTAWSLGCSKSTVTAWRRQARLNGLLPATQRSAH
jgi:Rha family phage regulatory protein